MTRGVAGFLGIGGIVAMAAAGCVEIVEPVGAGGSSSAASGTTGSGKTGGCAFPLVECDGVCTDLAANNQHCGGCDQACAAGEVCDGSGECAVSCHEGLSKCGGTCVDTQESSKNCGGCGIPCPPGHLCSEGRCALSCQEGLTDCGGKCVDTEESNDHCGGCDQPCPAGEICSEGACGIFCGGGTTLCGGACVDTDSSQAHCGGCDSPCTTGTCVDGTCRGPFHDSKIITTEAEQINAWVGTPNREWKLCYRKSEHGATASAFHSNCDNKGATIVVAELSTGRKIGAYAPVSWTSSSGYKGNSSAFLFSLTNNHKHTQIGNSNWMYDNSGYGPTFGGGHDWHVQSNMNNGYCNLGYSFACRTGSSGTSTCRNDFCGNYDAWTITELEVWYF